MILGYKPLHIDQLENTGKYLLGWINFHLPKANIKRFPLDLITGHGGVVFNLIKYLYGSLEELEER